MDRMRNWMWIAAAGFALLAVLAFLIFDHWLPTASVRGGAGSELWSRGTSALDLVVLKEVSNFLLGAVLLVAAGGLLILPRARDLGWPLLYVGVVQFATTIVADLAKPQFGRLRPFEAAGGDAWFVGANSFPSGHVAFYAGLCFPLMVLFPRWTLPLAIPPLFIAVARIAEHDHYPSDALASLALAALLSAAFSGLALKGRAVRT